MAPLCAALACTRDSFRNTEILATPSSLFWNYPGAIPIWFITDIFGVNPILTDRVPPAPQPHDAPALIVVDTNCGIS